MDEENEVWDQIDLGMNFHTDENGIVWGDNFSYISSIICPSAEDSLLYHINSYIDYIKDQRELHAAFPEEKEPVTQMQECILAYTELLKNCIEQTINIHKSNI